MKNFIYSIVFFLFACPTFAQKADTIIGTGSKLKVHVYYFHITNRCATCRGIEAKTIQTLDSLFQNNFKEGTLVFSSYNCELPENSILVKKYDAYGATLAITTFENGKEIKTEDLTNWAFEKTHKASEFKAEFAQKINELLKK